MEALLFRGRQIGHAGSPKMVLAKSSIVRQLKATLRPRLVVTEDSGSPIQPGCLAVEGEGTVVFLPGGDLNPWFPSSNKTQPQITAPVRVAVRWWKGGGGSRPLSAFRSPSNGRSRGDPP